MTDEQVLRCHITGNPCGTDTWKVGHSCECDACQTYLHMKETRLARAEADAARYRWLRFSDDCFHPYVCLRQPGRKRGLLHSKILRGAHLDAAIDAFLAERKG